jgi:hypothetical protein
MNDAPQPFDTPAPGTNTVPREPDCPGSGTAVDLAAFDEDFEQTEAADFEDVPDGKYQTRLHAVRLTESQKGDPMLKWDLVVISGAHTGRHIFKNAVITNASLPFIKGDLETLGLQLGRFSDLPNHLDSMLDLTLEVSKRTKGEYANVYFNRRIQIPANGIDAPFDPSRDPAPF